MQNISKLDRNYLRKKIVKYFEGVLNMLSGTNLIITGLASITANYIP